MSPDPLLGIQNFISRQPAFILWPLYESLNVTCLPFCFAAQAFLPISPAVQLLYLQHHQTKMAKLALGLQSEEEEGEALIPHPCSGEKRELLSARASPHTHTDTLCTPRWRQCQSWFLAALEADEQSSAVPSPCAALGPRVGNQGHLHGRVRPGRHPAARCRPVPSLTPSPASLLVHYLKAKHCKILKTSPGVLPAALVSGTRPS